MPNFFQKLESKNLIHTGVILIPEIIDHSQYTSLYENQVHDPLQYWNNFKNDSIYCLFFVSLVDEDESKIANREFVLS